MSREAFLVLYSVLGVVVVTTAVVHVAAVLLVVVQPRLRLLWTALFTSAAAAGTAYVAAEHAVAALPAGLLAGVPVMYASRRPDLHAAGASCGRATC